MGCGIHSHAERNVNGKWQSLDLSPFGWRSYGMYGFLAGVRNYSAVPPLSAPRGIPDDISREVQKDFDRWENCAHSASWLSVEELTQFNYDQPLENRRVTRNGNGGCTCEPGEGKTTTYREFLGEAFFDDLERLKATGAERIVFWFDN